MAHLEEPRRQETKETGPGISARCPPLPSCVLFRNAAGTVILLDIPRSLEEAQVPPGYQPSRRIISSPAVQTPFALPEPRDGAFLKMSLPPAALLEELSIEALVDSALQDLHTNHSGVFCLPRMNMPEPPAACPLVVRTEGVPSSLDPTDATPVLEHFIPEDSKPLHGSIQDLRVTFAATAPKFDLIVFDPPWPNKSARRKRNNYNVADSLGDAAHLLSLVPVPAHLTPDGLVAVWITNSPSVRPLVTGLLAAWGLDLVADWVWVKITAAGEPVFSLDSCYRKPWERLLIARRHVAGRHDHLAPKVMFAVPDLHSRKPNLRPLFNGLLRPAHRALEVFARNLTAGWWSWGDEVLLFQRDDHWIDTNLSGEQTGAYPLPHPTV